MLSAAFTDTLMTLTSLYSNLGTTNTNAYGSDYMPFQSAEYIITGYFENNQSPDVHSSNDILANLDTSYVFEIAKAATGATLYLAQAYENTVVSEQISIDNLISVYPNPVNNQLNIRSKTLVNKIEIYDMQGKLILESFLSNQFNNTINFSEFENGIFHYRLSDINDILNPEH
jgi:aminopeptidase YwaD